MLKHIPVSSENEPQDCPGLNFRDPLEQVQEMPNPLRGKQTQSLIQSASTSASTRLQLPTASVLLKPSSGG